MFAVFKSGNRQYKVKENDVIKIETVTEKNGSEILFDQVLAIGSDKKTFMVGTPFVKGAEIRAEIIESFREKKVLVFKKKRRKNYRRLNGHRQNMMHVMIKEITKK